MAIAAISKQAGYGQQFTGILEAGITSLMGKPRKVALHASHVASTEPRGLTGAPRDLHGLGLVNWYTANTANKTIILHHLLNGAETEDLFRMAITELWEVSQQTGALCMMTSPPCGPSKTPWLGRTVTPRSWALQTWIEMAKYRIGTSAIIRSSAMPMQHGKHILECCEKGKEQEVHMWSA